MQITPGFHLPLRTSNFRNQPRYLGCYICKRTGLATQGYFKRKNCRPSPGAMTTRFTLLITSTVFMAFDQLLLVRSEFCCSVKLEGAGQVMAMVLVLVSEILSKGGVNAGAALYAASCISQASDVDDAVALK